MFNRHSRSARATQSACPVRTLGVCAIALSLSSSVTSIARARTPDSPPGRSSASATEAAPAGADGETKKGGMLGPVRIGAFGGVGFPRPLSIEGMVKIGDLVGIGLEYSALPQLTVSDVNASLSAIDAEVRVFPLRNGFFIGVAAGRQHLNASATGTYPAIGTITEQLSAESWFVNPRIGFLWTWSWGLTVGIDAGAQIPVTSSVSSTIPAALGASQTANNIVRVFNGDVLPTVTLLRVGFLF